MNNSDFTSLSDIELRLDQLKNDKKLYKGTDKEASFVDEIKKLNLLKASLTSTSKDDAKKFQIKVPKGTRDFNEKEMALREMMFKTITTIFKKHGAITIDTPVFELKDILTGKYGEDSKLIYDLKDQGGEICSLRYDLTVPFSRFLAMNKDYQNIKRYHIAKVYRRDNPSINQGRLREFYQCDFDIAGNYDTMVPDAEVISVMVEILNKFPLGDFTVKVNHRRVLDGMFAVCGVPEDKIRSISSAVDKLDKMSWEDVKKEMTVDKGLDPEVADRIGEYVKLKGSIELCDALLKDEVLCANVDAKTGVEEMKVLFTYLDIFGVLDKVSFDLSLARGLDYYTGVIYEAVFKSTSKETNGVGSIAAGGRYDNLVGMFSGVKVPCVGMTIGVERIYAILSHKFKKTPIKSNPTKVYVSAVDGQLQERMKICKELWESGIAAEYTYKQQPKIKQQLAYCEKNGIPIAIIIGASEIENKTVKIKTLKDEVQQVVDRDQMIPTIKKLLENEASTDLWQLE
ncbi:Cytoplasmic and mitochondrial histidine tRNA synthetase [Globomyces sp. JEL0801]|nr:Cytoplasmic and mitochondrial histidine tRNA synthetase [Globomyces sp. JEL0801]